MTRSKSQWNLEFLLKHLKFSCVLYIWSFCMYIYCTYEHSYVATSEFFVCIYKVSYVQLKFLYVHLKFSYVSTSEVFICTYEIFVCTYELNIWKYLSSLYYLICSGIILLLGACHMGQKMIGMAIWEYLNVCFYAPGGSQDYSFHKLKVTLYSHPRWLGLP